MSLLFDTAIEPIRFVVMDRAQSRGSKIAMPLRRKDGSYVMKNGRIITHIVDDNRKSSAYMDRVKQAAIAAYQGDPLTCAVELKLTFYLARYKYHFDRGGLLKDDAPKFHTIKPDCLKLARGVEDALSKIVYVDDCQVVRHYLEKFYGEPERVVIEVTPIS